MEYYSAIKRNEMEVFVVRWMDLEVIQSEVSQKEENTSLCGVTLKLAFSRSHVFPKLPFFLTSLTFSH